MFGVTPGQQPAIGERSGEAFASAIGSLAPGGMALATGPSGAGKSTTLRVAGDHLDGRGWRVIHARPARGDRSPIELVGRGGDIDHSLGMLGAAGLSEAPLLIRPARMLSEGERARLALAEAMARAERAAGAGAMRICIACDEFCSTLDRLTAMGVGSTLHRWMRTRGRALGVVAICATAHEDMTRLLSPDMIAGFQSPGRMVVREHHGRRPRGPRIDIDEGSIADFDALAHLHYRGGRPGTWQRVLSAMHPASGALAGVLVVSPPTRRGRWRSRAWPGRYAAIDRAGLARLNREVRCITRVIVGPRFRGLGVARRLVRAYLDNPLTPATEAVSAMAAACPFFERAGMRPYRLPPGPADQRLADALEAARLEPCDLMRDGVGADDGFLRRELERWWSARRGTMAAALIRNVEEDHTGACLQRIAAWRLSDRSMAFAHAERVIGRHDEKGAHRRRAGAEAGYAGG